MNLLDWRKNEEWLSAIKEYAGNLINSDLLDKIKSKNIKGCWSDDMSWISDEKVVENFKTRFLSYYSHVKAFHGCRPINVSSYYDNGFLGQNRDSIETQFRNIFRDICGKQIEKAILDLDDRGNNEKGKIYFACSDIDLIEDSGQYLIQGSEYITAMAASLRLLDNDIEDYKLRLREVGVPTIFEVNIPLKKIPRYQVNELVRAILAGWGTLNLFPEDAYDNDMSFVLYGNVSPEYIIGHSHPTKIKDPYSYYSWYHPKITSCEMCELKN